MPSSSPAWTEVDTRHRLDSPFAIDPYLVWAELSDWEGFGDGRPAHVRVLMELARQSAADAPGREHIAAIVASNPLNFPTAQGPSSRYVTACVPVDALENLVEAVRSGVLVRFQLGLARGGLPDAIGQGRPAADHLSRPPQPTASQTTAAADEAVAQTEAALEAAADASAEDSAILRTIGVIDDGCCLGHEGFRSHGRSDFLLVWDQNAKELPQLPWTRFDGVSYGEELWNSEIDEVLAAFPERGEPGERRLYTEGLHRPQWGDAGRTHGAGVLHVAWNSHRPEAWGKFLLMFVQLPTETVADTSGGSLGVYIVDGVRYLAQRTRDVAQLIGKKDYRCNINISLGSIAGPHDGSTITELALAELGADSRVQIAIAAGNTAGTNVHAVRHARKGKPGRFDFIVPPDNPRESYIEVWLPVDEKAVHAEAFTVEVIAPNGCRSQAVAVGKAASLCVGDRTLASLVFLRRVAQGLSGTMVLLAIRSTTALDEGGGEALYGPWSIEVSTTIDAGVAIHAWVERNDILIGARRPQQTRFVNDPSRYVDDEYTLSSVANGENVVVVGAFRLREKAVSPYSANGPTLNKARRRGPDVYGAADRSAMLPGRTVPGFWSGTTAHLSGTSGATPHVARWMARGRPDAQVCEVRTTHGDRKARASGVTPQDGDEKA